MSEREPVFVGCGGGSGTRAHFSRVTVYKGATQTATNTAVHFAVIPLHGISCQQRRRRRSTFLLSIPIQTHENVQRNWTVDAERQVRELSYLDVVDLSTLRTVEQMDMLCEICPSFGIMTQPRTEQMHGIQGLRSTENRMRESWSTNGNERLR